MRRRFTIEHVGRRRRSAARAMARLGISAGIIAVVLGLKRETAIAIVQARHAPGSLWSAAEQALFRESRG
ncbi:hypothetical protein FG93_02295 [Bosea sp. LC85]|uniref:hypothetical protein n=1 Tax=Bosea sp. LC85 TaxID=1502851 RepID=UPI0004E35FCD|nr:hypothetical protein [Bosea sp. LC85]KFC72217.1 hypothetical protein FG93_02295 [Bosea sp. LC85]